MLSGVVWLSRRQARRPKRRRRRQPEAVQELDSDMREPRRGVVIRMFREEELDRRWQLGITAAEPEGLTDNSGPVGAVPGCYLPSSTPASPRAPRMRGSRGLEER